MNIVYTCDDNFVWIAGISMISLYETNRETKDLSVYLLGDNVSKENKELLKSIAKRYDRTFTAIDVPDLQIPEALCNKRWPRSAYTRLFSGLLLPTQVEKVLYLDCDTIITDNISQLNEIDIKDYTIFGVKDCISRQYKENIGLNKDDIYINAGVLLINLNKMRQKDISKEIETFFNKYEKTMFFADQDVLNGILRGKVGVLHPKYDVMTLLYAYSYSDIKQLRRPTNYYSKELVEEAVNRPAIIHFTTCMTNIRPWFKNSDHPYAATFEKYWQISPWKLKEKQFLKNNTKESKLLRKILCMPKLISMPMLGILHALVRPLIIRYKSKYK